MPIENESRTTRIRYSDGIVQLLLGFYSRKIKLNLSFGPFQCCEVVVALCLTRRKPVEAPSEYKMVLVFSYISSSVCNSVLERLKITIASQCVLAYSCFFNDAVIAKMISVVFSRLGTGGVRIQIAVRLLSDAVLFQKVQRQYLEPEYKV